MRMDPFMRGRCERARDMVKASSSTPTPSFTKVTGKMTDNRAAGAFFGTMGAAMRVTGNMGTCTGRALWSWPMGNVLRAAFNMISKFRDLRPIMRLLTFI
jgi:hypothetical protein